MDPSLAETVRHEDRERWLSILWSPPAARPALIAIHALDLELARVVAQAREPMLAEIRLAWWREQVQALGRLADPPAQPILRALAGDARPRGVDLAELAAIEDGHLPHLLEGPRDPAAIASARGGPLFVALATALAAGPLDHGARAAAEVAGAGWAMARLLRDHGASPPAGWQPPPLSARLPRPLLALGQLAAADISAGAAGQPLAIPASPARQWRIARTMLGI